MKCSERFLKQQGLNPNLFCFIRQDAESYVFLYKPTGKAVAIRR